MQARLHALPTLALDADECQLQHLQNLYGYRTQCIRRECEPGQLITLIFQVFELIQKLPLHHLSIQSSKQPGRKVLWQN